MPMELPARVQAEQLSGGEVWDLHAVYKAEHERLSKAVGEAASQVLAEVRYDHGRAAASAPVLEQAIKLQFAADDESPVARDISAAQSGELRAEAGSEVVKNFVFAMMLTCLVLESGLFMLMYLIRRSQGDDVAGVQMLLLQGVLLAVASFFLGRALFEVVKPRRTKEQSDGGWLDSALFYAMLAVTAATCIVLILYLRYGPGSTGQSRSFFVLTLALVSLSVGLTTYNDITKWRYDRCRRRFFGVQRRLASKQHLRACEEGHWRATFVDCLKGYRDVPVQPVPPLTAPGEGAVR